MQGVAALIVSKSTSAKDNSMERKVRESISIIHYFVEA